MKVLVIGSGCREHALAWKLAQSERVEKVFIAPGNGGTAAEEKCENLALEAEDPASPEGQEELLAFAGEEGIDLTIVGPENPLAGGIADLFRAEGLGIIGPDKKAARLEASKIYSKKFMAKYGVRTAGSKNFSDIDKALKYAKDHFEVKNSGKKPSAAKKPAPNPLVIKADGLAAGKGVVIAGDFMEADAAIYSFMKNTSLGEAGTSLLIEEFLEGKEVSIMAAVSVSPKKGGGILPFISARDHKRRFEGAQGPNTGGMGSIAPVPDFSKAAQDDFIKSILAPTLKGMKAENLDYRGFIFFGLMVKDDLCYLLEYNVRLGDPETEAVLPLMNGDFADLCTAILEGGLGEFRLTWKKGAVCAPVAVAEGYPGPYRKGISIALNETAIARAGAKLFIGGAQRNTGGPFGSGLRSSGGRVLAVSAFGADADEAWVNAYRAMGAIDFEGMSYRKDIGREKPGDR
jgi:phosphoribosylamine--glycine ligase